eukprot:5876980-Ditylum_brightwellii.AAC.1
MEESQLTSERLIHDHLPAGSLTFAATLLAHLLQITEAVPIKIIKSIVVEECKLLKEFFSLVSYVDFVYIVTKNPKDGFRNICVYFVLKSPVYVLLPVSDT